MCDKEQAMLQTAIKSTCLEDDGNPAKIPVMV